MLVTVRKLTTSSRDTLRSSGSVVVRLEAVLEQLHMSRSRHKRAMNEAGLPPPATYIRNLRLREAASLLERRRGNISEVAYAVGFASVSHFSRRFREHFGITPSEYMER